MKFTCICVICGVEFKGNRSTCMYHSDSCRYEAFRRKKLIEEGKPITPKICKICGKSVGRGRNAYCGSECAAIGYKKYKSDESERERENNRKKREPKMVLNTEITDDIFANCEVCGHLYIPFKVNQTKCPCCLGHYFESNREVLSFRGARIG